MLENSLQSEKPVRFIECQPIGIGVWPTEQYLPEPFVKLGINRVASMLSTPAMGVTSLGPAIVAAISSAGSDHVAVVKMNQFSGCFLVFHKNSPFHETKHLVCRVLKFQGLSASEGPQINDLAPASDANHPFVEDEGGGG